MSVVPELLVAALGVLVAWVVNRVAVTEPGYVITDPGDLPEGADPALLDELEPAPTDLPPVPVVAILRPGSWWRWWFPVVEVVLATLYAVTVAELGWHPATAVVLGAEAVLVTLAVTDFRVYRIPDRINFPATAVVFAAICVVSLVEGMPGAIFGAAVGGFLYAGMLFLAHVVSPRGMGWGDVKMAWLMGFVVGWLGSTDGSVPERVVDPLRWVLMAAAAGSVLGVVSGGIYALVRRSTKAVFPYGPALVGGCIITAVWGTTLIS